MNQVDYKIYWKLFSFPFSLKTVPSTPEEIDVSSLSPTYLDRSFI